MKTKPQIQNEIEARKINEDIMALEQMVNDKGWKIFQKEIFAKLEKDLKILTGDGISTFIDGDLNKIKYSEYDLLRIRRGVFQELLRLPERIITKKKPILAK